MEFVHNKVCNGRSYKMLTVLEYIRYALAVVVRIRISATVAPEALYPLLLRPGADKGRHETRMDLSRPL